ncbi:hypothetical protein LJK87_42000 [Paenibacillus sp. P25]|nr:hypothetical protein LJK87_42000 [Paenibacillus sp. P25]
MVLALDLQIYEAALIDGKETNPERDGDRLKEIPAARRRNISGRMRTERMRYPAGWREKTHGWGQGPAECRLLNPSSASAP